ncbi:MAG: recombinase family protein [Oscillospiraceae bacterium]|nr:recombinase family protein [Oscillospiraceae bacterium]
MEGTMYGYVRVSTQTQNEARQLNALRSFGVEDKNIVVEKKSGKNFDRSLYRNLVKKLRRGDVLVIQSIDRLGRDYTEILEQWRYITKTRKADIVVLDMPLLDTRQGEGRDLTSRFIADLVLQLLSYVAEREYDMIRQRQAEGIAAAKARGVRIGRQPVVMPESFQELALRWREGEISSRAAAEELGVSHTTFQHKAKAYFNSQGI